MNNKLFLICPTSHIEAFIKERYGQNAYFLTALGVVFNFYEIKYAEALKDFLEKKAIKEVFIVNHTSCQFIKSILEKEKGFKTKAEEVIQNLLIDNYSQINSGPSLTERKTMLATLNIQRQVQDILSNELLLPIITQLQIRLKGVLTTKEKGWLKEVQVKL